VERHHDTTAVRIFGGALAQLRCRIGGGPRRRGRHCASHLASVSWCSAECCVLTVTDESVRQMGKVARPAMLNRNSEQGEGGQGGAGSSGGGCGWQKRKKKEVFIYGNYRNYYGYRMSAKPFVLFPGAATLRSVFTRGRQLFDDMPRSRFRCSWGLGISVQLGRFGLTHDPEKVRDRLVGSPHATPHVWPPCNFCQSSG
jgi:hypothetical protein